MEFPFDEDEGDAGDSRLIVRLLDHSGAPVPRRAVALAFTSPLRGMTADEMTDGRGLAVFDCYRDGEAKVFAGSEDLGTYFFRHGCPVTVTVRTFGGCATGGASAAEIDLYSQKKPGRVRPG